MTVKANLYIDLFPPSGTIPNKNSLSVLHTQDVLAQCNRYIHKWLLPIVSSIHVVVLFDRVLPTRDKLSRRSVLHTLDDTHLAC